MPSRTDRADSAAGAPPGEAGERGASPPAERAGAACLPPRRGTKDQALETIAREDVQRCWSNQSGSPGSSFASASATRALTFGDMMEGSPLAGVPMTLQDPRPLDRGSMDQRSMERVVRQAVAAGMKELRSSLQEVVQGQAQILHFMAAAAGPQERGGLVDKVATGASVAFPLTLSQAFPDLSAERTQPIESSLLQRRRADTGDFGRQLQVEVGNSASSSATGLQPSEPLDADMGRPSFGGMSNGASIEEVSPRVPDLLEGSRSADPRLCRSARPASPRKEDYGWLDDEDGWRTISDSNNLSQTTSCSNGLATQAREGREQASKSRSSRLLVPQTRLPLVCQSKSHNSYRSAPPLMADGLEVTNGLSAATAPDLTALDDCMGSQGEANLRGAKKREVDKLRAVAPSADAPPVTLGVLPDPHPGRRSSSPRSAGLSVARMLSPSGKAGNSKKAKKKPVVFSIEELSNLHERQLMQGAGGDIISRELPGSLSSPRFATETSKEETPDVAGDNLATDMDSKFPSDSSGLSPRNASAPTSRNLEPCPSHISRMAVSKTYSNMDSLRQRHTQVIVDQYCETDSAVPEGLFKPARGAIGADWLRCIPPIILYVFGVIPAWDGHLWTCYGLLVMLAAFFMSCYMSFNALQAPQFMYIDLMDAVFALGCCVGLLSLRLNRLHEVFGSATRPLDAYASNHGFKDTWTRKSWRIFLVVCSIWVLDVTIQLGLVAADSGADTDCTVRTEHIKGTLYFASSMCVSGIYASLTYCFVHISCALAMMVDDFCIRFFLMPDGHQGIQNWNVIQAFLRSAAGAMDWPLIATGTASLMGLLLVGSDTMFGERPVAECAGHWLVSGLLPLLPKLLLSFYGLHSAATVTEKCRRAPSLVNSLIHDEDTMQDLQPLVQYINHSAAGFYIKGVHLCRASLWKYVYLTCVVIFYLISYKK